MWSVKLSHIVKNICKRLVGADITKTTVQMDWKVARDISQLPVKVC